MAQISSRNPSLHSYRSVGPTRLSPHWFFPDGDLLLRCNSTLYLVHSAILSSASGVFRDALRRPAPTPNMPSLGAPIMGGDKCRTHSKSHAKIVLSQQPGLSLSAQLWLRQNQRRRAMGKPVERWGSGKTARAPKVLVIEDREINVDYLLYFLYSRPETPITKDFLPHILSLGIRYQISSFTSASLSLLKTSATINPFFVIKTLHPFIPPPGSNFTSPTNIAQTTTVITSIYNMAITALLDDFPRCLEYPESKVGEEYKASVPLAVQQKCIDRWNRYIWDMSFLKFGQMFTPFGCLGMKLEYEHDESCAPRQKECLESTQQMLLTQWLIWWDRETVQKSRLVPKPSQLRVFLETVEAILEDMETEGEGRCVDGVMRGMMKMFAMVFGPGIWEDGEEGFQGLRIDEEGEETLRFCIGGVREEDYQGIKIDEDEVDS